MILLLTIFFTIYLHSILSSYFQYKTVTNVDRLRRYGELPPMKYFLCATALLLYNGSYRKLESLNVDTTSNESFWMESTYDLDYTNIFISRNEKLVRVYGNPFLTDIFKCWNMDIGISNINSNYQILEDTYQIEKASKNFEISICVITKSLNDSKYVTVSSLIPYLKNVSFVRVYEMSIVSLLPLP